MKHLATLLLLLAAWSPAHAGIYLTLESANKNHVNYTYDGNTGIYSITTTGGDPYMYTSALSRVLSENETHLVFEYKCPRTIAKFQLYFGNSWSENRSQIYGDLTATGDEWREMDINLSSARSNFSWGNKGEKLRFDFGFASGYSIQIRNITIGAKDDPAETYKRNLTQHLKEYLATSDDDKCGIELWSNIETFQRPFPGHGEPKGVFRQGDYRTLYMKLQEASPLVKKIITYEYFSCMSPNTEWGSSRRLLARYMEMIGKDPALIDEVYGKAR